MVCVVLRYVLIFVLFEWCVAVLRGVDEGRMRMCFLWMDGWRVYVRKGAESFFYTMYKIASISSHVRTINTAKFRRGDRMIPQSQLSFIQFPNLTIAALESR